MGYILRIGYRHIDAIKFQALSTLGSILTSYTSLTFKSWLRESAPELLPVYEDELDSNFYPTQHENQDVKNYARTLFWIVKRFEEEHPDKLMKTYASHSQISSSASPHAREDYAGTNLGGAWNAEQFVLRGAIILTLGGLEEYERGVLRILFANRNKEWKAQSEIFAPRLADFRFSSQQWQKLEKQRKTYTYAQRSKLFEKFDIKRPDTEWRARLDQTCRNRNRIAHGYEPVSVSLMTFLQLHYDAFAAMYDISKKVLDVHNIDI